jgi:flotillin
MSLVSWLILAGAIIVFLALFFIVIAKQYRKVGPNEALIISGRKKTVTGPDGM